jgi:hypothetical protein
MGAATVSGRGTSHLRTPIRALGPRFSFRRRAGANDTPDPGLDGRYISPQKVSHDAGAMSAGTRACGISATFALVTLEARTAESLAAR